MIRRAGVLHDPRYGGPWGGDRLAKIKRRSSCIVGELNSNTQNNRLGGVETGGLVLVLCGRLAVVSVF